MIKIPIEQIYEKIQEKEGLTKEQIDEIYNIYKEYFNIPNNDILCLHMIGAGRKVSDVKFKVHEDNIESVVKILKVIVLLGNVFLINSEN